MNLIIHKRTVDALVMKPDLRDYCAKQPKVKETYWDEEARAHRVRYRPFVVTDMLACSEQWLHGDKRESVDISDWELARCETVLKLLTPHKDIYGVQALCYDLESWLAVCAEGKAAEAGNRLPRTCHQAYSFMVEYLRRVPSRWIYSHAPGAPSYAYYVCDMEFVPERRSAHDGRIPPEIRLRTSYYAHGAVQRLTITIEEADCVGVPIAKALLAAGYVVQTPERRAAYEKSIERLMAIGFKTGLQCVALGAGTPCDPPKVERTDEHQQHHGVRQQVDFALHGGTRVVVDDMWSTFEEPAAAASTVSSYFWKSPQYALDIVSGQHIPFALSHTDIEEVRQAFAEDKTLYNERVRVPIHPDVNVFSLKHHKHFNVHVDQLTPYVYDAQLAKKVVIPAAHWDLIDMLIENGENRFADIVAGKGDGAIVLCEGAPGTGKTLTAEAFSEKSGRPLYNVQASQLGVETEALEHNLSIVFDRARRWNAIVLIDEADVYVARRGSDLVQNAIVGVFLRVLEYQPTMLFFTTNRADLVDDAILSRCIARITYRAPEAEADQITLWRTLAAANKLQIPDGTLVKIAMEHPRLSGRDVKNLLKLAVLYHRTKNVPITSALIKEVRQYKPTVDWRDYVAVDEVAESRPSTPKKRRG